jgi:hypothetical protein
MIKENANKPLSRDMPLLNPAREGRAKRAKAKNFACSLLQPWRGCSQCFPVSQHEFRKRRRALLLARCRTALLILQLKEEANGRKVNAVLKVHRSAAHPLVRVAQRPMRYRYAWTGVILSIVSSSLYSIPLYFDLPSTHVGICYYRHLDLLPYETHNCLRNGA